MVSCTCIQFYHVIRLNTRTLYQPRTCQILNRFSDKVSKNISDFKKNSNGFSRHRSFGHKSIYQNYHLDDTGNILCVIVWMKFMVSEAINSVFYTLSIDCILNCPLGTVCPILPTAFQVYTKVCISRPS